VCQPSQTMVYPAFRGRSLRSDPAYAIRGSLGSIETCERPLWSTDLQPRTEWSCCSCSDRSGGVYITRLKSELRSQAAGGKSQIHDLAVSRRIPMHPSDQGGLSRRSAAAAGGRMYFRPGIYQAKMREAIAGISMTNFFSSARKTVTAAQSRFLTWEDLTCQTLQFFVTTKPISGWTVCLTSSLSIWHPRQPKDAWDCEPTACFRREIVCHHILLRRGDAFSTWNRH
jgi:hypothetical protein